MGGIIDINDCDCQCIWSDGLKHFHCDGCKLMRPCIDIYTDVKYDKTIKIKAKIISVKKYEPKIIHD